MLKKKSLFTLVVVLLSVFGQTAFGFIEFSTEKFTQDKLKSHYSEFSQGDDFLFSGSSTDAGLEDENDEHPENDDECLLTQELRFLPLFCTFRSDYHFFIPIYTSDCIFPCEIPPESGMKLHP